MQNVKLQAKIKRYIRIPIVSGHARIKYVITFIIVFGCFLNSYADTIYLKNGRSLEGFILREEKDSIEFEVPSGVVKFQRQDIERISISDPQESAQIRRKWQSEKSRKENVREAQERRPRRIELAQDRGHIVVEALLNNKGKASLLLDTGASLVIISESIAQKTGIDLDKINTFIQLQVADGRKINAKVVVLKSLSVQGVEAKDVEAAIMPDNAVQADIGDGLLGMSFLKRFNFTVDYTRGKLVLEKL